MKTRYILLVSLLTFALAACRARPQPTPIVETEPAGPEEEVATATPAQPASDESPLPEPESSPLPTPLANPARAAAVDFLARELGVSADQITVVSSEAVDWPDASLGCPEPGVMYAQVITPGYKFVLEAGGETYEVHTDEHGNNVVRCESSRGLEDPDSAFKQLLSHLKRTHPGLGLDQIQGWSKQDITKEGLLGSVTLAWRGGDWTLEMTYNVIPRPDYESKLFHEQAGVVWQGTLQSDGEVTLAEPLPTYTYSVGECDERITAEEADDWAGVEVSARDDGIDVEQNLYYVCCAYPALAVGRDGDVLKVIESNAGEVCRCWCGYPITATLSGIEAGAYTVEVWGVQYQDEHPLALLGSAETTLP